MTDDRRIHWDRAILCWLGIIPLALVAAPIYHAAPIDALGFPLIPSVMLIAYIFATLGWVFDESS